MHNIPRFGHKTNISTLAANEYDTSIDYYLGFTWIVSVISMIFFIWTFVLTTLKVLDARAGCASGRAFQMHRPEEFDSVAQRIVKTRISFLFFGLLFMGSIASLIMNASRIKKSSVIVNSNAVVS